MDDIKKILFDLIFDSLAIDINKITLDTRLVEDLKIDLSSMDYAELLAEIEVKFNIKIQDEDSLKIKTIGDILEIVKKTISKNENGNE